jgi:hypothetical protein
LPRKKKKEFKLKREVKAIARERLGPIPPSQTIPPKADRKKPKHKKRIEEEAQ